MDDIQTYGRMEMMHWDKLDMDESDCVNETKSHKWIKLPFNE
jgi:hypothetical protein